MREVYVLSRSFAAAVAALELAEVGVGVRIAAARAAAPGWGPPGSAGVRDPDGHIAACLSWVSAAITADPAATSDLAATSAAEKGAAAPSWVSATHAQNGDVAFEPLPARDTRVRDVRGGWSVVPEPAVAGIPAVPISQQAAAVLGARAAARAYLDRVKPVLTIGKIASLGELVQKRYGAAVVSRLVDPLMRERYGCESQRVDVAIAAPGLNEALTRAGSLSGAVLMLADRQREAEALLRPRGGWETCEQQLWHRLQLFAAEQAEHEVIAAVAPQTPDGRWQITEADGSVHLADAIVVDGADAGAAASRIGVPVAPAVAVRVIANAQISAPPFSQGGAAAVSNDAQLTADALQMVVVQGETWTVRWQQEPDGQWWARVASPTRNVADGVECMDTSVQDREAVTEALHRSGAVAAADTPAVISVQRVAAPFATLAEREAATETLQAWREAHPDVLVVGSSLHGGDLANALRDARDAAVLLRRKLTGIV